MTEKVIKPTRIEIISPEGLALRQLIPDDAQAYFDALHHDPSRFKHGEEKTLTRYATVEAVRQSIEDNDEDILRMGVWDGVAMVAYARLRFNRPRSAELGYWSGYGGKGYSEKASGSLIEYAFADYPVEMVTAWAAVDNIGSIIILNNLGFNQTTNGREQVFFELHKPDVN